MKRALITGSFDPPTVGHIDIIRRAAAIFDEVIVCVCVNSAKQGSYTYDTRMEMLRRSLEDCANVTVDICHGLVAEYAAEHGVDVIVKGVRNEADFAYEQIHAAWNLAHNPRAVTLYLPSDPAYAHLSSTLAREKLQKGESLEGILAPEAAEWIMQSHKRLH